MKTQKICFCGAPHSGKSTAITELKQRLDPQSANRYNITFIDEVASHVLATSELHPRIDQVKFQSVVALIQLLREERAIDGSKNNLIFCDRCLADTYIYTEDNAEYLLEAAKEEILDRYDAIIFFDSYIKDDNVKDGNELRYENTCEIMALEEKTLSIYSGHKSFHRIPSYDRISDKIDHVSKLINELLGENIFEVK